MGGRDHSAALAGVVVVMKPHPSVPVPERCMPTCWTPCKTSPTVFLHISESSSFPEWNVKS